MIEPLSKKEIREQISYIRKILDEHQEDWYLYESLNDGITQLEILLERYEVI